MKEAIIRMLNEVDDQGLRCVYAFLVNYLPWPEETETGADCDRTEGQ